MLAYCVCVVKYRHNRPVYRLSPRVAGFMTLRNGQPYWRWLCIPDWPSFQISLTESGTLAIERALPLQQREIRRCFGAVLTSEQLNCLIEIAEAISTHLKDQPAH